MSGAQQDMHVFTPEEFLSPHTALVTRADPFADDLEQKYIMTYKATFSRRLRSDADDFYHPSNTSRQMKAEERSSRFIGQVQYDLEPGRVWQAFDEKLKSYFCRMTRAQEGYKTKKIYIKVGSKNPVSKKTLEKKLLSSGIGRFMKVERIAYSTRGYSQTMKFFRRHPMEDDEVLRIPGSQGF